MHMSFFVHMVKQSSLSESLLVFVFVCVTSVVAVEWISDCWVDGDES